MCLGYRDAGTLFFKDETRNTVLRVKRFENRKISNSRSETASNASLLSEEEDGTDGAHAEALVSDSANQIQRIQAPLTFSVEAVALMGYMEGFVQSPRHPAFYAGHLHHLPKLLARSSAESPLTAAAAALSFAAASNSSFGGPRSHFLGLARENYSKAITRLGETLPNPLHARNNETLLTILLFVVTEVGEGLVGTDSKG